MSFWLELAAAYVCGLGSAIAVAIVGGRWYAHKKYEELQTILWAAMNRQEVE